MGLHEGANTFFDADGKLIDGNVYVPLICAAIRSCSRG
jgi:hypothetical protein